MRAESLPPSVPAFADLALSEPVLAALQQVGYEAPSPIQAQTIPPLLRGEDVVGQAQTGTGKTAAFALPILSKLELARGGVQTHERFEGGGVARNDAERSSMAPKIKVFLDFLEEFISSEFEVPSLDDEMSGIFQIS